jgi:hypothetical protein
VITASNAAGGGSSPLVLLLQRDKAFRSIFCKAEKCKQQYQPATEYF